MEKFVEQTLLYDFYGELLTEHQKTIYEAVVFDDMGYSEIADEQGVSRQGIFDLIKRVDKILNGYEEKLHLVEKFLDNQKKAAEIKDIALMLKNDKNITELDEIIKLADEISE